MNLPGQRARREWYRSVLTSSGVLIGIWIGLVTVLFVQPFGLDRQVRVFLAALTFSTAAGAIPASRLVDWLDAQRRTVLVDIDPDGQDVAVWALTPDEWEELEVVDGELYRLRAFYPAWGVQSYDPEEHVAEGTWRGSKSDIELVREYEAIRELREDLLELAEEGVTQRMRHSSIVWTATKNLLTEFAASFESETLYQGEEVQDAVNKVLDGEAFHPEDVDAESEEEPGAEEESEPVVDGEDLEENVDA